MSVVDVLVDPGSPPTRSARPRWTVPRTSSRTGQRPRLLRADQQLRPGQEVPRGRGEPADLQHGPLRARRAADLGERQPQRLRPRGHPGRRRPHLHRVHLGPDAGVRRPGGPRRPTSPATPRSRSARSSCPTTSPSTRSATCGSPPTATRWAPTTACSGSRWPAPSGARSSSSSPSRSARRPAARWSARTSSASSRRYSTPVRPTARASTSRRAPGRTRTRSRGRA